MIEYAEPFDRVRTHALWSHPVVVVRFLEGAKGSLVVVEVDLNIDRVGNEEKSLRAVIYLPMSGTKLKDLSPLMKIGIL